jgi:uridylate kinase
MKEKVVIKVGGSLLSRSDNDLFDFRYAYHLSDMIKSLCEDGYAVALNVGGGYLNRKYIALLKENGEHDITDQHLVGIAVTNLNAQIMRGLLGTLVPFDS